MRPTTIAHRLVCWVFLVAFLGACLARAASQLALGNASIPAGKSTSMSVTLTTDTPATAVQFDVRYEATQARVLSVSTSTALNQHRVDAQETAPGAWRVLLYSLSNALLPPGEILSLQVDTAPTAPPGTVAVLIEGALLANPLGASITPLSLNPGTLSITRPSTGPPLVFRSVLRTASGAIQMELGGVTGRTVVLQTSTDLANWVSIVTNAPSSDTFLFVDPASTTLARRFYRAIASP